MKHIAFIAALCAGPAFAQDAANFGGTGCIIAAVDGQTHVAEVTCHNAVTSGNYHDEASLSDGGIAIGLLIDHGPGDKPDRFTVIPPDGYIAEPQVLELEEHGSGVIRVYAWQGA